MYAYNLPLSPPCDEWNEYVKPDLIRNKAIDICAEISKHGDNTRYSDVLDLLCEYIGEGFSDFFPELCDESY